MQIVKNIIMMNKHSKIKQKVMLISIKVSTNQLHQIILNISAVKKMINNHNNYYNKKIVPTMKMKKRNKNYIQIQII